MWTAAPQSSSALPNRIVHPALNARLCTPRSTNNLSTTYEALSPVARISNAGKASLHGNAFPQSWEPCSRHSVFLSNRSIQGNWSSEDSLRGLASLIAGLISDAILCKGSLDSFQDKDSADGSHDQEDRSREAWLVDEVATPFNHISVIDIGSESDHEFAGAYVLKLDERDLVHSVSWHDRRVWTGAYYDEFTLLPLLLPAGPISILGLGAGTVARLLRHVWPSRRLEGWEVDLEVVRVGRAYFGLADLEVSAQRKAQHGRMGPISSTPGLIVHVGDALREDARAEGRFAGLIVDLYMHGQICDGLKDSSVWAMLRRRLLPGGRVMVNCGGPPVEDGPEEGNDEAVLERKEWVVGVEATVTAMSTAFDGDISFKQLTDEGRNVMLLSGEFPSLEDWSGHAPRHLTNGIKDWHHLRVAGKLDLQ